MNTPPEIRDDFIAEITILTADEGGRKTPPRNGVRWDFLYEGDVVGRDMYMIWPVFQDSSGHAIADDVPLAGTLRAKMYILNSEGRKKVHRARIRPGVHFFCMEGPNRVARGSVIEVTGLNENAQRER